MRKLLIVTGGTKGIGKAIILKFMENGFDICTCARNKKDLENLKTELGKAFKDSEVVAIHADLSSVKGREEFSKACRTLDRPADVLINNAGLFIPGKISEEENGVLEQMIGTNLYSAYDVTRAVLPGMVKRGTGHIFNICSTASITPYINGGSYCISKYAMYGMTKVLREEMKDKGIRVTAVLPGATLTASWEGADLPAERFMKASDVADTIYSIYNISKNSVVEEILLRPQLGDIG